MDYIPHGSAIYARDFARKRRIVERDFQSFSIEAIEDEAGMKPLPMALLVIYLIGVLFLVTRFIWNIKFIKSSLQQKGPQLSGMQVVLVEADIRPYSFFHYLFVNKAQFDSGALSETILKHELAHANQFHSLDILFAEVLTWALWFNPFVWMYKKTISENHEYIVDDQLIYEGANALDYSKEILRAVSNLTAPRLVSGFSYLQTKNRLTMISKGKSNKYWGIFKLSSVLLLVGGMYLLNSCNEQTRWPDIDSKQEFFEKFQAFQDIKEPTAQYEALRSFGISMTDEEFKKGTQHGFDSGDLEEWTAGLFRSWAWYHPDEAFVALYDAQNNYDLELTRNCFMWVARYWAEQDFETAFKHA